MVVLRAGRTAPPVEPVLSARRTPQHSCGLNRAATGIRISRLIAAGLSGGSPSTVDRGGYVRTRGTQPRYTKYVCSRARAVCPLSYESMWVSLQYQS